MVSSAGERGSLAAGAACTTAAPIFIGHRDALSRVLEFARIRPKFTAAYESYQHHLARRV